MKTTKENVLAHLLRHSDTYCSGETVAAALGISRNAVWKAIQTLRQEGIVIEAVSHRGYRLTAENDLLTPEALRPLLEDKDIRVLCYPQIDSTNSEARRLLNEGAQETLLLTAETQTAGRGRQGKSFYSPAKTGVYMTLVTHPGTVLHETLPATAAAAVAVCRAIEKLTDLKPQIKWVNDIYLGNKKIAGILTEAVTDLETQTVSALLIGIGINIATRVFPADVENAGGLGVHIPRAALAAAVTNELCRLHNAPYAAFIDAYRRRSMLTDTPIVFWQNGVPQAATALDIDARGGLRVQLETGAIKTLRSGEISVRQRKD